MDGMGVIEIVWMVAAQVVAEYSPPAPEPGPAHRYLTLALLQVRPNYT